MLTHPAMAHLSQMMQVSLGHWGQSQRARLEGLAVMPGVGLIITPLLTKRISPAPLAQYLSQASLTASRRGRHVSGAQHCSPPACQSGILTLDQARNLLPIRADDPMVMQMAS